MGATSGPSGQRLKLVQSIEQGAESAKITAIERNAEAGEGSELGFVSFLRIGITKSDEGFGPKDVVEIIVESDQGPGGDLSLQADDHDVADVTVRVEVVVEVDDFTTGEFEIIRNLEEGKVLLRDETVAQKVFAEIFFEGLPEIAAGGVDHDQGDDVRFPCLHQSERFEGLVHGAEPSREESDGIGVFDEVELAGEEIFEGEELAVPPNGFIGFLFEREFNIEGEAVLAACSGLSRAHNSLTPSGDHHIAGLLHELTKLKGRFVGGAGRLSAGGTEDGDFFDPVVGGKDLVGIPDFPHNPFELLEVTQMCAIGFQAQDNRYHLLKDLPFVLDSRRVN